MHRKLDLLGFCLRFCEPLEKLRVALWVGRAPLLHGWQANLLLQSLVRRGHLALYQLLAVHGRHARERRRVDFFLLALYGGEVEADHAQIHVHHLREDTLGGLPGILVGLLLCPRQSQCFSLTSIRELLLGLHEKPRAVTRAELQHNHIHHTHQLLVLLRIQHKPRGTSLHLLGQLVKAFGLGHAEDVRIDLVLHQRFPEHRQVHWVVLRSGALVVKVQEPVLLDLVLGHPLVGRLAALHDLVSHNELLVLVVLELLLRGDAFAALRFPVHSEDQFLTSFLDAVIDAGLHHTICLLVSLLFCRLVVPCRGLAELSGDPRMSHHLRRAHASLLALVQHLSDVFLTDWVDALRDSHLLVPDIVLVSEREPAANETVHDNAHGPDIDLLPVVAVEELWGPEDFRADSRREPIVGAGGTSSAKVCKDDLALLVRHVLPVHEVVVTFHVPVGHVPLVEVVDGSSHLVRDVNHVEAINLTALLEVALQSLYEVAAVQLVHDNTHKAPLIVDAVKLDNIWVVHARQHISLLADGFHWRFNLVHHLHCKLLPCGPSLAH
mmetsp:Transcript_1007/g.2339  ORF Transcript_1007/g.2339 Transcript_1007/m.2339 type:complete len:551 (+) Transcript_1007:658-2310(+)